MRPKAILLATVAGMVFLGGCGQAPPTPEAAVRQFMGPESHPVFLGENLPLQGGQLAVFYKLSGSTAYAVVRRQSAGWRELGSGSGFGSTAACGWAASSRDGVTYIAGQFSAAPVPYSVHVTAAHTFRTGLSENLSMYVPVDGHGFWAVRLPFNSGNVPIVGLTHHGTVRCN